MPIESIWEKIRSSAILSVLAGIVSVVVAIVATLDSSRTVRISSPDLTMEQQKTVKTVQAELATLTAQVDKMRAGLDALSHVSDKSKVSVQLKQVQTVVVDMQARQAKLEAVILANPAKALEIPLLQRDLDNLKAGQQEGLVALRQSVDRIYDLNKWLLGAMAVSIVTLALSNFLRGRESSSEKKTS